MNGKLVMKIKVDLNDCMLWAGAKNQRGYGIIMFNGKYHPVHRLLYESVFGDIPKGYDPDHLCEVRACINLDHIEIVTHRENSIRGNLKKRRVYCARGHKLSGNNLRTYFSPNGAENRQCKACAKLSSRLRYLRYKEKLQQKEVK